MTVGDILIANLVLLFLLGHNDVRVLAKVCAVTSFLVICLMEVVLG